MVLRGQVSSMHELPRRSQTVAASGRQPLLRDRISYDPTSPVGSLLRRSALGRDTASLRGTLRRSRAIRRAFALVLLGSRISIILAVTLKALADDAIVVGIQAVGVVRVLVSKA